MKPSNNPENKTFYTQDIKIVGWCPARLALPYGKKGPWLATLLVTVSQ